ncbi:hypothetical protein PPERSA_06530 [Pseudocohnilembus persalinus]|uniref:EF-hand domain-containing protein n=1 Tax=Pseudocohnilembus persalinus TaxID=266149 RepID=A0A0V0QSC0_PSEPJ|nr:hypothetical protein PPERSA_06530 [Pseudocohnilembus persalinus]|eukprot:KRX04896.1 hypothetical protein PPERSA_06530 [Pseudocohnilembus persalinus]
MNKSNLNHTGVSNTFKGTSTQPINRNAKQEISSEEQIMSKEISTVEQTSLNKVFELLCSASNSTGQSVGGSFYSTSQNPEQNYSQNLQQNNSKSGIKDYFTARDVMVILNNLEYYANKSEVEQMIWEINDSLNGRINRYEFDLMYKRCCFDQTGLEPRNLYNVVQYLMYLQNRQDDDERKEKKTITVEDTLELLYVRYGRQKLDHEIDEIFGEQKKYDDGQEKELTLAEYLTTIKKKDYAYREQVERERQNFNLNKDD